MQAFEASSDAYIDWMPQSASWNLSGEDPVKVTKTKGIVVVTNTLLTGWGVWPEGQAVEYQWSDVPGSRADKPGPDWKKAFSLTVHLRKEDGWPMDAEALWRTPKVGSFQSIAAVWPAVDKAGQDKETKLARLKIKGITEKQFKGGRSTVLVNLELDAFIEADDTAEF
jgi:hypothetical protein